MKLSNIFKTLLLTTILFCTFDAFSMSDTLYINIGGNEIPVVGDYDKDNDILVIGGGLDSTQQEILDAIEKVKRSEPQSTYEWIVIIFFTIMPMLNTWIARLTKTVSTFKKYFKNTSNTAIVVVTGLVLGIIGEFLNNGMELLLFSWKDAGAYAIVSIGFGMFIYEAIVKKYFGKTPKDDDTNVTIKEETNIEEQQD